MTGSRTPRTRTCCDASCAHRSVAGNTPFDNRDEAAEIFLKHAPAFNMEIALLEIDGTMSILRTKNTEGKAIGWSAIDDWKDTQALLEQFAKLKPQPDMNVYYTNEFLAEAPYAAKK